MTAKFAPRAIIRRDALRHNAQIVRQLAPDSKIMAMVKANAYGHGVLEVADALADVVQGFGVARLDEAFALRAERSQSYILVASCYPDLADLQECARQSIALVVHDLATAQRIAEASLPAPLHLWLKMNTGMNRLGMCADDFQQAQMLLRNSENCTGLVLMSHLSSADEPDLPHTQRQLVRFRDQLPSAGHSHSLANSAAIIHYPHARGDWVRPGIMLYGESPGAQAQGLDLQAVMELRAPVLAIHELVEGEHVGYGATWTASRPSRIATLALGYADGYPRHAPNGTPVLLKGQRVPLAGRVSMDLMSVDVTDVPDLQVGDEAIAWGQGLPAATVAESAGTIAYELLSGLQGRVAREYT